MDITCHNRHHYCTMLLWELGCHGNQSETSLTHSSGVLFASYLVLRFLDTIGISLIPHCYENMVAMATTMTLPILSSVDATTAMLSHACKYRILVGNYRYIKQSHCNAMISFQVSIAYYTFHSLSNCKVRCTNKCIYH